MRIWKHKVINILLVMLATLFLSTGVKADVNISGFVDMLYQDAQKADSSFGMGAFEIDFAMEFQKNVSFEGAVVVEGDEVGLGQTLIDIKLADEYLGLQAGLLDIPFGIDCCVFATPDRKFITLPLVTELMMDGGWADVGANVYGTISPNKEVPSINYNLYMVNGIGYDSGADDTYGTADDEGYACQLSDNNNANTIGGRLGILPIKDLEIGVSFARGPYLDDNTEEILQRTGGDVQFKYGPIETKAEYIRGKEEIPAANANKHSGFYSQILGHATDKLYVAIRYGERKQKGSKTQKRITPVIGYDFIENVSFRTEWQINTGPAIDNNLLSSQIVISF